MNPDTIGYLWTGEFDLNTLRVDGEIFESGKKKLRIQKYPDTCGRDLRGYRIEVFGFNSTVFPHEVPNIAAEPNCNAKVRKFIFKVKPSSGSLLHCYQCPD